ncbi:MAG TPA: cupin fold metalloprotein, WbuC family [Bacteroidales bacterium]|nr:MAG: hypothetical protein A2X11_13985 [Bacteroidetes bacterium GWE2_42_24]OFY28296.1 MAG: hypothetical protein A2X09_16155 [Bacteroidetes bacterium GWF2_43_11]PKP27874.1 MAG: cupin fold metalloprotein, WbuC family [Bacteroidetes bacterium HGW-Bacteroidetes-22]HAQ64508.1 cupin fold metalloprotein, WbuC family [Bacteroidales bacterium]HBZ66210.1 cupin fold metalloprotein, WbuC family [Bacteroidales bacterium]
MATNKKPVRIDALLLDTTSAQAKVSQRRRMNFNFHDHPSARIQRMLNAMEPGTYIRPHKHENPDKLEVFFCLRGSFAVVIFDDTGAIIDLEILNPLEGRYGVEIGPGTWHCLVALEAGSVAYEVKDGPYDVAVDKNFALWAPREDTPEAGYWVNNLIKIIQER